MKFFTILSSLYFALCISIQSGYALEFTKIPASQEHPQIWFMPTKQVPTVSLKISFPIGYADDPKDKLGLATLAAATLDEGAGHLDSNSFQELLADYQISLNYSAGQEYFTVNLDFLKFDSLQAIKLANLSLNKPRFDIEPIELMRNQLINHIKRSKKNPSVVAGKLLKKLYYKEHVFSKSAKGTISTLRNIKRDDLKNFHKKLLTLKPFISIVGDVSKEEAITLSKSLLDYNAVLLSEKNMRKKFTIDNVGQKIATYIDVPQSTIMMATPAVKRNSDTFIAYYIATHILGGGGFGSYLVNELREKRGITYSVSVFLDSSLTDGRLLIQYSTDNKHVQDSLKLVTQTLHKLAQNGITQNELNKAKTYLKGQYNLSFETNNDFSSLAQGLKQSDLQSNYPQKRDDLFDAVTLKQVNKIIKKLFSQDFLTIVVGGNKKIENFNFYDINK